MTFHVTAIGAIKLTNPANELHSNEEEPTTTDSNTTRFLTSFGIGDNRPATGVDNISNTVENIPGSGYRDYPWIMPPAAVQFRSAAPSSP